MQQTLAPCSTSVLWKQYVCQTDNAFQQRLKDHFHKIVHRPDTLKRTALSRVVFQHMVRKSYLSNLSYNLRRHDHRAAASPSPREAKLWYLEVNTTHDINSPLYRSENSVNPQDDDTECDKERAERLLSNPQGQFLRKDLPPRLLHIAQTALGRLLTTPASQKLPKNLPTS